MGLLDFSRARMRTPSVVLLLLCGCSADSVTIAKDPAASGVDIVPATNLPSLTGHVTHAAAGVGSVGITLLGPAGQQFRLTTTNDGLFRFENLPEGTWKMTVTPPSYFALDDGQAESRQVELKNGRTEAVTVTLKRPGGPATVEINLLTDSYDPQIVSVPPGTRIRWTNVFARPHTISPGGHWAWRLVEMSAPRQQFEVVLNNPGTFPYLCEYLYTNGMTGTITVWSSLSGSAQSAVRESASIARNR
jgi:plastocyanin